MLVRSFAQKSLELLAQEAPWAYARMTRHLTGVRLRIDVDSERLCLEVAMGRVWVHEVRGACEVRVNSTRAALRKLLTAGAPLVDAVLAEELQFQGSLQSVLAAHDGLVAYLEGGVRCPGFPALMQKFLDDAPSRACGPVSALGGLADD